MKIVMFSVVIPSSDRKLFLTDVIKSYSSSSLCSEVIIIDNSQKDDYTTISFDDKVKVVKVPEKFSAPEARNLGIEISNNDWVFFGEDDAYLESGHLEKLSSLISEYGTKNIYSGILVNLENYVIEQNIQRYCTSVQKYNFKFGLYFIPTNECFSSAQAVPLTHALFAYNKRQYSTLKFYTQYSKKLGFREESDLQMQIRNLGGNIIVTGDTCVGHLPRKVINTGGHRVGKFLFLLLATVDTLKFFKRHRSVLYGTDQFLWPILHGLSFPFLLVLSKFINLDQK